MNETKTLKWVIFSIVVLAFPMPYFLGMAAGTMPLFAYYLGTFYSLFSGKTVGIPLTIITVLNTFLVILVSRYLLKAINGISRKRTKLSTVLVLIIGATFIPWHWAFGVNKPRSFNTIQLYSYHIASYNKSLQRDAARPRG